MFMLMSPAVEATEGVQPTASRTDAGQLVVTATDTLDGRLPGATVMITGPADDPSAEPHILVTDDTGRVQLDGLPPGTYVVEVEMPGFDPARVDVTVSASRTSESQVTLGLGAFVEQVAVTQEASEQQNPDGFAEQLSQSEIDQLPDDPEDLAQMLEELAGGEAEFRVNGFEGGELPPKDQIMAIRIRQDPFGPDSMGAGRPRVEIVTRPGSNAWKSEVNAALRDQSVDARQPFAPERGVGQTRRLTWSFSGPLVKNRTSIAGRISTRDSFDAQTVVATGTAAAFNDIVNAERGTIDGNVRVEHALTQTHTLRVEYQHRNYSGDNLGVGEFNLRERAFGDERQRHVVRVSDTGTFGTKFYNEFRVQFIEDAFSTQSVSDALTVNVQNAFTAGGAQRTGGQRDREFEIANNLEFAPNDRHKMRVGVEAEVGQFRSDRMDNAIGRFTFASLDDYAMGMPRQFVQRIGDPLVDFSRYEVSWWVHDDITVSDRLRVGLGLRHDFQGYLDDKWNLAPRVSVAWTPSESKRTTYNAGLGVFNNWLADSVWEQTLRLDGERQRDLIVRDPSFPDPFDNGAEVEMPPPSVVRLGDQLAMQQARRISFGVEHRATDQIRLRLSAFGQFTGDRLRAVNVNAPVNGLLPDPAFNRITEISAISRARSEGVDASIRTNSQDRRTTTFVRYRYTRAFNDADGALSLPADGNDLDAEWGPASQDVRHRIYASLNMRLPLGVRANVSGSTWSGAPYTITTGFDDNNDTVFNDRPGDLGRNTERGVWQRNVDLRLGWRPDFIGDAAQADGRRGQNPRGMELYGRVTNLFNETNFTRFAGVLTSPFFGQPIAAGPARRFELGTRVFF